MKKSKKNYQKTQWSRKRETADHHYEQITVLSRLHALKPLFIVKKQSLSTIQMHIHIAGNNIYTFERQQKWPSAIKY